jgi:alpha-1,2-mannosyltransferase
VSLDLEHTFGLRLLTKPRVRFSILVALTAIVLGLRVVQFAIWTGQPVWAYDFSFYWTAASNLLHGLPIYSPGQLAGPYSPQAQQGFLYPPALAALVTPLVALGLDMRFANWIWSAAGAAVLVWAVLAIAREERLDERFALLRGRGRWWLVAAAFAFPPVVDELVVGNVHLFLVGLLTAAWIAIRRCDEGRRGPWYAVAGTAVGAATLIKVFPGLLILWFVFTGRVRAAIWSIVAVVVLAAISLPITRLQPWLDYPTVLANLSLTPQATDALAPTFWLAPYLGFSVARYLVTGIGVLVFLWVLYRAGTRLSFATTIVLAVLMTPALYTSYLTVLVVPLLLGLAAGVSLAWLALAYFLMWGGQQAALGDLAWIVTRALPTAGALLLLAILVRQAVRKPALEATEDHQRIEAAQGGG